MALVLDGDNGIVGVLATNNDGDVIFDTNTLFVDAVENKVGIGTISPGGPLEISNGSERHRVAFDTGEVYLMARNASAYINQEYIANQHVFTGYGDNSSNEAMRIDSSGRVKIGTTSNTPASANEPGIVFGDNTAGTPTVGVASFVANSSAPLLLTRRINDGNVLGIADDTTTRGTLRVDGGDLNVSSNANLRLSAGGSSSKMTILATGNVGIGTTNPRATLDTGYTRVYNSGAASSPTDGKGLEIHYVTSNRAQGEGAYVISYDRDNSEYKQFTVDADSINLSTGGTTKVSVTNVGVIQGVSDAEIATSPIRTHSNTISTNTTIDANDNAVASGPLGIADGVTLTINGNMTVV